MKSIEIDGLSFEVLISTNDILDRVVNLSSLVKDSYKDELPLCLIVLNGAAVFANELLKYLDPLIEVSLIKVKSYDGVNSSAKISLDYFPKNLIKDRKVLLIEDVVDTGLTLDFLRKELLLHSAQSVECITLLFKPTKYKYQKKPDYIGFYIGDEFVVGYGMDLNQKGRSLKNIYRNIIHQN